MADAEGKVLKPKRPRSRTRAAPMPDTPDPIEIAMAEVNAGRPGPGAAQLLLEKQARLIDADLRHRVLQMRAERLTIVLRGLLGLAAAVLAIGLGAMAWNASQSRGLVFDAFQVPPAFAQQGLTGEVVASKIIDRLTEMRADTISARAVDALESGWRNDFRVEVPQTGIAVGEVQKALRRWLGNDTRIGGELTRTANGIALTVRSERGGSATVTASEGEFDSLIDRAADALYARTAPYLHAIYMQDNGRVPEAMTALRRLAQNETDNGERAWALMGLGSATMSKQGRCADAIPILERSHRFDPRISNPVALLASAHLCLGHNQAAADLVAKAVAISRGGESKAKDPARARRDSFAAEAAAADALGDYRGRLVVFDKIEAAGLGERFVSRANAMARLGDARGSKRALDQFRPDPLTPQDAVLYWQVRLLQARVIEDWRAAARHAERSSLIVVSDDPAFVQTTRNQIGLLRAEALARLGQAVAAEAVLRGMPDDCYPCSRARAAVAEARGDRAGVDRWFRHALQLGPRLPFAYHDWGKARLRRGDPGGALSLFERALAQGPEFADAHKGKGDALARLGRKDEAVRAYAAAAKRAPRWGALHIEWGKALWRSGRQEEARAKFRAAAGMDLSAADRARLSRIRAAAQGRATLRPRPSRNSRRRRDQPRRLQALPEDYLVLVLGVEIPNPRFLVERLAGVESPGLGIFGQGGGFDYQYPSASASKPVLKTGNERFADASSLRARLDGHGEEIERALGHALRLRKSEAYRLSGGKGRDPVMGRSARQVRLGHRLEHFRGEKARAFENGADRGKVGAIEIADGDGPRQWTDSPISPLRGNLRRAREGGWKLHSRGTDELPAWEQHIRLSSNLRAGGCRPSVRPGIARPRQEGASIHEGDFRRSPVEPSKHGRSMPLL